VSLVSARADFLPSPPQPSIRFVVFAHIQNFEVPLRTVERVGNPILPCVQTELIATLQAGMLNAVSMGAQLLDLIQNVLRNGWIEAFELVQRRW
jgi:hypothetical protein